MRWHARTWIGVVAVVLLCIEAMAAGPKVSLVLNALPGLGAKHGARKLEEAIRAKGLECERAASLNAAGGDVVIVAGRASGGGGAALAIKEFKIELPEGAESLVIAHVPGRDKTTLLLSGGDDRGVMYAMLEVADRIAWAADPNKPLSEVKDARERPYVPERALSIYTMHQGDFERKLHDEKYWEKYLDMLARNRFSTFVIIFGYECDGYMAPAYPWFFDVEGFENVKVVGITKEQQAKNLAALNRVIRMTHERGLNFTPGLWDHIYRGGVQGSRKSGEPGTVVGLSEKNLMEYTRGALTRFLKVVERTNAIQFRMHGESGLKGAEMAAFWSMMYDVMNEHGKGIRFDARAKEFPDSLIDLAIEKKVPIRICTKYWMEQLGLPFHPTHIPRPNQFDRRHQYADLLRYPQRYRLHWRLWSGGTTRILLWGDPEWVRRFAESTHLYDGDGFEVNEPLATRMNGQPHELAPFPVLNEKYRYYEHEFERYWHFYQLFGRVSYNPQVEPELWHREFERRFGKEAGPFVEKGLHRASQILPRIIAAVFPYGYFPTTRGWAEKQRWGDLPQYIKAEGGDTQQFMSFADEVKHRLAGEEFAKVPLMQTSQWFAKASADVLGYVQEAERRIGDNRSKEFVSTMTDLRILAHLSLYHSRRIPGGIAYAMFKATQDVAMLDEAIQHEQHAIDAWEKLVQSAGDVYADNLAFGLPRAGLSGHWRDELAALKTGLEALKQERRDFRPKGAVIKAPPIRKAWHDTEAPSVTHEPIARAPARQPLRIRAIVTDPSGVKWVRVRYRGVNQHFDYQTLPMQPTDRKDTYQATIPADQIDPKWDFMYFIEAMDKSGNGRIHPDLEKETPYVVVRLVR